MTYEQFIAESKRLQRKYVRDELKRMQKATRRWERFKSDMAALGLHPMLPAEIAARERQLRDMGANVETTHGDSTTMRALFQMQVKS